jgi:hypothetical protein
MTRFCAQCGKDVKDNVKFCPHCGHLREGATPTKALTAGKQKERRLEQLRQRVESSFFKGIEDCLEDEMGINLTEAQCLAEKQRKLVILITFTVLLLNAFAMMLYLVFF